MPPSWHGECYYIDQCELATCTCFLCDSSLLIQLEIIALHLYIMPSVRPILSSAADGRMVSSHSCHSGCVQDTHRRIRPGSLWLGSCYCAINFWERAIENNAENRSGASKIVHFYVIGGTNWSLWATAKFIVLPLHWRLKWSLVKFIVLILHLWPLCVSTCYIIMHSMCICLTLSLLQWISPVSVLCHPYCNKPTIIPPYSYITELFCYVLHKMGFLLSN